jgi:hypothetical protein
MRPICINHGCDSEVTFSHKDNQGNRRWRIHCGHCQAASYGKWPHRAGVTPYKTGKCTNVDGHLGFDCSINWEKIPSWANITCTSVAIAYTSGTINNIAYSALITAPNTSTILSIKT